jgi:hypothetical protein
MSIHIIQSTQMDDLCIALDRASDLLTELLDSGRISKAMGSAIVHEVQEMIKDLGKAERAAADLPDAGDPPPRLTPREAYFLTDSIREVRDWSDGRRTEPPVGLGNDLDRLGELVGAVTTDAPLTAWDKERAKAWGSRRG